MTPPEDLKVDAAFDEWKGDASLILTMGWPVRVTPPAIAISLYAGSPVEEDGGTVYMTDGVLQEWAEWYPDVSVAIARVAAVVRCAETDRLFSGGPRDFQPYALQMLNRSTIDQSKPVDRRSTT